MGKCQYLSVFFLVLAFKVSDDINCVFFRLSNLRLKLFIGIDESVAVFPVGYQYTQYKYKLYRETMRMKHRCSIYVKFLESHLES